jgi:hypothetical protein
VSARKAEPQEQGNSYTNDHLSPLIQRHSDGRIRSPE